MEGLLDPLCAWEDFAKGPKDWWARLKPYFESRMPSYVARHGRNDVTAEPADVVAQNIIRTAQETEDQFRIKSNKSKNYWRILDTAAHWDADDGKDIVVDALNPIMEWNETHNSHTFVVFVVEDILHMQLPQKTSVFPSEYAKQFVDVVEAMVSSAKV